ncbi:hypothetical protein [Mycetocola sp. JXN-3]|uniref:hypothetical protein n=1 Tax=Mycetocola sp. JXN-3 TaxID=2116510 RepID=UPI00165CF168|nr:hypothetical protein [Mycetocola sp. JXN-3]
MIPGRETVWRRYWPLALIALPEGFVLGGLYGLVTVGVASPAQLWPTFAGFGLGGLLFTVPAVMGSALALWLGDRGLRHTLRARALLSALGAVFGVAVMVLVLELVTSLQVVGQDFGLRSVLIVVVPLVGLPAALVAAGSVVAWEWRLKPRKPHPATV